MAITRLWQSGAETGSTEEFTATNALTIKTTTPHTGTYEVAILQNYQGWARVNIPATYQLRASCFFNHLNPINYGNTGELVSFYDSGNILRAGIRQNQSYIYYYINGSDTQIAANIDDVYVHYGIDVKMDGSSGWINVYQSGILVGSFAGNTGNYQIAYVRFGSNASTAGGGSDQYFDDMYIDDTTGESAPNPVPPYVFPMVSPIATGNYADWIGSDLDQTDNYQLIDERPPSTSDYITGSGVDLYDSYGISYYGLSPNEQIKAVIPIVYGQRFSVTEKLGFGTRYSATDVVASGNDLPIGSYAYRWDRQTTKPGGGTWDQTSVSGFEILVRTEGTY